MARKICPTHGYYDASEDNCPICQGEGHGQIGLGDNMPTAIGRDNVDFGGDIFNSATELGENHFGHDVADKTELGLAHRHDVTEIEITDNSPIGLLCVKEGPRRGQIHKIKDSSVLGRSRGDIIIDDPKASSCHAKFTYEDEKFYIWDFGTKNGTHVNGERIRSATELKENDEIKIGDILYVVKFL